MKFEACPKCERLTLYGTDAGVSRRLSALVIPFEAAKLLSEWGELIYTVRLYAGKAIVAELWSPSYGKTDWLVLEHHCGQDAHNWRMHPPTYGNVPKTKPSPSPNVRGFDD